MTICALDCMLATIRRSPRPTTAPSARRASRRSRSWTSPSSSTLQRVRQENPGIEFIVRLFDDRISGSHTHPTPAAVCQLASFPRINELRPYATKFEIHNEPNHYQGIEGWGNSDATRRTSACGTWRAGRAAARPARGRASASPGWRSTTRTVTSSGWTSAAMPCWRRTGWAATPTGSTATCSRPTGACASCYYRPALPDQDDRDHRVRQQHARPQPRRDGQPVRRLLPAPAAVPLPRLGQLVPLLVARSHVAALRLVQSTRQVTLFPVVHGGGRRAAFPTPSPSRSIAFPTSATTRRRRCAGAEPAGYPAPAQRRQRDLAGRRRPPRAPGAIAGCPAGRKGHARRCRRMWRRASR